MKKTNNSDVTSEIGQLTKVMIHSPDGGIGNILPSKLKDWLYDDIIDVEKTQAEHAIFISLLLLFLQPESLYNNDEFVFDENVKVKKTGGKRIFEINPEKDEYFAKNIFETNVLDTQFVLQNLFEKYPNEAKSLIEGVCSIEGVHIFRKKDLQALIDNGKYKDAVKTLLTGKLEYQMKGDELEFLEGENVRYIFPPIPNFIFTRDIGVKIGDYLLVTKPRFDIRKREVILLRFIAEYLLYTKEYKNDEEKIKDKRNRIKIIEVSEDDDFFQLEEKMQDEKRVNYEGGDFMMISPKHLLIGCSERTSPYAIEKLIYRLFWKDTGIEMVSVVKISEKRSQMHIDTILTHLKTDTWIMYAPLSEKWQKEQSEKSWRERSYIDNLYQKSENQIEKEKDVTIFQFYLNEDGKKLKEKYDNLTDSDEITAIKSKFKKLNFLLSTEDEYKRAGYKKPKGLEDLLTQISRVEYEKDENKVKIIYSGKGEMPYSEREQYTDACNLLILKEGVAVGYDRNLHTAKHFHEKMENEEYTSFEYNGIKLSEFLKEDKDRFGKDKILQESDYVFHAKDLIKFVAESKIPLAKIEDLTNSIKNALILIPSDELSRARGGSHCMTMPLVREKI